MTSTLRTVPEGGPEETGLSVLAGPEAFNLTLAGLDQLGRGGGHGLSFFWFSAPSGVGQTRSGAFLSSEGPAVALGGPSFTPLIRLLRCSRSSGIASCFGFVWTGVFLVGCRADLGSGRGLRPSGGLTGCCLERAT